MPETLWYKARFSRRSALFNGGHKVYTEDVGSSSLSSPTNFPCEINILDFCYEVLRRFIKPVGAPLPAL